MGKKKISVVLAALITLCVSGVAFAWDSTVTGVTILKITALQDGSFYIQADKDLCDPSADNRIGFVYNGTTLNGGAQPWTERGANMMLSVATAAQLSGRTVTVYADNSTGWGCRMGAIRME